MLDIFNIGKIVFIVAAVVQMIRYYKTKKFEHIPYLLMIAYFFLVSLIYEIVPKDLKMVFIYSALTLGVISCLLTSRFYGKRKDRFRYWFCLIFAISLCFIILLGVVGVIG